MPIKGVRFDTAKARETITRGRRANWWHRRGTAARGFSYFDKKGRKVVRRDDLERIATLAVPPAWKHVRINPGPGGKIQAVGMDTTGRVQYLYHPKHTARQSRRKFEKVERFAKLLPKLQKMTNRDIALEGLPREKVIAVTLRLINCLYFRVGSEHSAVHYKTFGITTLRKDHLSIGRKGKLSFNFVGKSHVQHRRILVDDELSAIMKELDSLGRGRKLFRYLDDCGKPCSITPADINTYLKDATEPEFSSKDLRTWGGTLLAAIRLAELGPAEDTAQQKKNVVKAVKYVAEELGNTPAVCRGSYIHPFVINAYCNGITIEEYQPRHSRRIRQIQLAAEPEEHALLKLLQACRESAGT
ncbi:MAG: hypothetical protein WBD22_04145 [Pyrinomonadaceae bacterium]